jgi:hypothetical protein
MKLGHFTAEALKAFAEAKGLYTKNQDFSEGVFDFKICEKPDGKFYGIPDEAKCKAPNREATARPDTGFLGSKQGRAINYDTAKGQGDMATWWARQQKEKAARAAKKKADDEAAAKAAAAAKAKAAAAAKAKAEADRKEKAESQKAVYQAISDIPKLTKYYNEEYAKWVAPRDQQSDESYYNALRMATDAIANDIGKNAGGLSPYGKTLTAPQRQSLANDIMRRAGQEAPGTINFIKAGPGYRMSLMDGDEE